VWVLQAGGLVNTFGFGLILPFEIIYLHSRRGFSLPTAGLVLSTVMAAGAVCAGPAGTVVDRLGGKPVLLAASVLQACGYGLMAFVQRPWQGFLFSAVAGIGSGGAGSAAPTLTAALTTAAERVAAFTFNRVVINLGIGLGAVVGGAIAARGALWSFQLLYLLDAATFLAYAVVASRVPNARPQAAGERAEPGDGYRRVLRDLAFVSLVASNVLFVVVGFVLFSYVMPPFARERAGLGTWAIGLILFTNTLFIIVAQLPIARYAGAKRRLPTLAVMSGIWAAACLLTLAGGESPDANAAFAILAAAGIVFGVGECLHAVVVGPLVTELAPSELVGRYFSLLTLSTTVGLAVGPSLGAVLLGISPAALWISAAAAVAVLGAGLLRLERRFPEAARGSRPAIRPPASRGAPRP
jgi:MFS family permease